MEKAKFVIFFAVMVGALALLTHLFMLLPIAVVSIWLALSAAGQVWRIYGESMKEELESIQDSEDDPESKLEDLNALLIKFAVGSVLTVCVVASLTHLFMMLPIALVSFWLSFSFAAHYWREIKDFQKSAKDAEDDQSDGGEADGCDVPCPLSIQLAEQRDAFESLQRRFDQLESALGPNVSVSPFVPFNGERLDVLYGPSQPVTEQLDVLQSPPQPDHPDRQRRAQPEQPE